MRLKLWIIILIELIDQLWQLNVSMENIIICEVLLFFDNKGLFTCVKGEYWGIRRDEMTRFWPTEPRQTSSHVASRMLPDRSSSVWIGTEVNRTRTRSICYKKDSKCPVPPPAPVVYSADEAPPLPHRLRLLFLLLFLLAANQLVVAVAGKHPDLRLVNGEPCALHPSRTRLPPGRTYPNLLHGFVGAAMMDS